jgi:uncharacterized membrane-anchored protein
MKSAKLIIALFTLTAAAQLIVPGSLIIRHELTLRRGTVWKFKTAPVDPADAFRGRYVALSFEERQAPLAGKERLTHGQKAYATLETNAAGFTRLKALRSSPPADKPYLKVHVASTGTDSVEVQLPFDRFYLEEHTAPAAEQAYRQSNRRGQTNATTYALVRVRRGSGVIENVFVDGKPIRDVAREQRVP